MFFTIFLKKDISLRLNEMSSIQGWWLWRGPGQQGPMRLIVVHGLVKNMFSVGHKQDSSTPRECNNIHQKKGSPIQTCTSSHLRMPKRRNDDERNGCRQEWTPSCHWRSSTSGRSQLPTNDSSSTSFFFQTPGKMQNNMVIFLFPIRCYPNFSAILT